MRGAQTSWRCVDGTAVGRPRWVCHPPAQLLLFSAAPRAIHSAHSPEQASDALEYFRTAIGNILEAHEPHRVGFESLDRKAFRPSGKMLKTYERPRVTVKSGARHCLRKLPFQRSRRLTWCCCCLIALAVTAYYFYLSASTGVGGESFPGILVQCVYKSYASVDSHQKSGEIYNSASDVLTKHGQRWGQSALSSDFGTDKMDRHNYTLYYDILLAPYLDKDVNLLVNAP